MSTQINYLEFPACDLAKTKAFFQAAFGWEFTDYGPEYTSFSAKSAGLDGGFFKAELASKTETGGALCVFYSTDLKRDMAAVKTAGGAVVKDIFEFPGGRRFHFIEPSGNEFAIWSDK